MRLRGVVDCDTGVADAVADLAGVTVSIGDRSASESVCTWQFGSVCDQACAKSSPFESHRPASASEYASK